VLRVADILPYTLIDENGVANTPIKNCAGAQKMQPTVPNAARFRRIGGSYVETAHRETTFYSQKPLANPRESRAGLNQSLLRIICLPSCARLDPDRNSRNKFYCYFREIGTSLDLVGAFYDSSEIDFLGSQESDGCCGH
jgi:hypothetical protein